MGRYWEAVANIYAGEVERALEIFGGLSARSGPAHVYGRCGQLQMLALVGRSEQATTIADDALAAAHAHANPFVVAWALYSYSFAYARSDPARARNCFAQSLAYARDHRLPFWEALTLRETARLEAVHGDLDQALSMYDSAIESIHQSGDVTNLAIALLSLTVVFVRAERPDIAATLYGVATTLSTTIPGKRSGVGQLRGQLGDATFQRHASSGAAMEPADAVRYARTQIELARQHHKAYPRHGPDAFTLTDEE